MNIPSILELGWDINLTFSLQYETGHLRMKYSGNGTLTY